MLYFLLDSMNVIMPVKGDGAMDIITFNELWLKADDDTRDSIKDLLKDVLSPYEFRDRRPKTYHTTQELHHLSQGE